MCSLLVKVLVSCSGSSTVQSWKASPHQRTFWGPHKLYHYLLRGLKFGKLSVKINEILPSSDSIWSRGCCTCNDRKVVSKKNKWTKDVAWQLEEPSGAVVQRGTSIISEWQIQWPTSKQEIWITRIKATCDVSVHFGVPVYWKERWHETQTADGWFKVNRRWVWCNEVTELLAARFCAC